MPLDPAAKEIIRRHWRATTASVLASEPPCLGLRDQAVLPKGRRCDAKEMRDLAALRPGKSWVMAIILCPGDNLQQVAAWAVRHRADGDRFILFHVAGVDLRQALAPWRKAGFGLPLLVEVETWLDMAGVLGSHINNVILRDHGPMGWPV